jgi:hypothetical protein
VFAGRHHSSVAAALLLAAAVGFGADARAQTAPAQSAPAQSGPAKCEDALQIAVLPAPLEPWKGAPLRVLLAAEKPLDGELSLIGPDGTVAAKSRDREGGPPYYWYAEVATPAAGTWHATLALDRETAGCGSVTRDITVGARKPAGLRATAASLWPLRNNWNRANEDLFSAWIAKLFDAPLEAEPSWKVWFEVLRDPSRNMLFDYLGLDEEKSIKSLKPDCADFVYFLRAYFSFKMGLPFAYSNCSRGMAGSPPKCYQWFDVLHPEITRPAPPPEQRVTAEPPPTPEPTASATPGLLQIFSPSPPPQPTPTPAKPAPASRSRPAPSLTRLPLAPRFGEYLRIVGDVVHTGSVRVSGNDDNTDFYMVPLTQDALRPGTVYADPYGHVLMLVKRVPQTSDRAGVFLAVDAEPDGTVTRKRFWRGNFLFVHEPSLGSPGFKHFRPIVREKNGALRRLTNAEIAKNPQYGDFSLEQTKLGVEDFYDKMDQVMSPSPLNPDEAMDEAISALDEQVKTRVVAVENGRKYQSSARGDVTMPSSGPSIFETTGAWEDYSTPARDFRLLVALDVVTGYPDRVERHPERYAIPAGKSPADVKAELQAKLAAELAAHKFTYTRSDGSTWTLTLKDVVDREAQLEMGYNPNDCVELRWGAAPGSDEASTCKRHAPSAQRAKMTDYRNWFHDRHWPHA